VSHHAASPAVGPGAERLAREVARRSADERKTLWPDQVYTDAVWESLTLTVTQKMTALCYAKFANRSPDRDRAWVVYPKLMAQTGIRSRETVAKVHQDLIDAGWLEAAGSSKGHKQRIVYRLALPKTGAEIRTGTESRTGTDFRSEPVRKSPEPVRISAETSAESGTQVSKESPQEPLHESLTAQPTQPTAQSDPDDFERWWSVYPKKEAKGDARKAWLKAVKKAEPARLIAAAALYRDRTDRQTKYTRNAATWLNGECWLDEPTTPGRGPAENQQRASAGQLVEHNGRMLSPLNVAADQRARRIEELQQLRDQADSQTAIEGVTPWTSSRPTGS
jgi:hypothetical protein